MRIMNTLIVCLPLLALGFGNNVKVHFHVCDEQGHAITNATIRTVTQRDHLSPWRGGGAMREVVVSTDMDGRAVARFPCYSGEFDSYATAPGYYDEEHKRNEFKYGPDSTFYANLLEHEKSLSFTLRRKINPIPMFHGRTGWLLKLPGEKGRFGFDIRENDWVSPHGRGLVSDFEVEYSRSETNGIRRFAGALLFPGAGDGAYKMKKMPFSYCSVYNADTNAVFSQRIEFVREVSRTNFIEKTDVLDDGEYLVLRTRTKLDADGHIVYSNYSKIYGSCICEMIFYFQESFFNPTLNDTNLEFDEKRNLTPWRWRR